MSGNNTLSHRKRRFIVAVLETPTIAEAARQAKVSEATAWRYLRDPNVKMELAARQEALLDQVTSGIIGDMTEARQALADIVGDKKQTASVRARAAGKLLDAGPRLFEILGMSRRLDRLEVLLGGKR